MKHYRWKQPITILDVYTDDIDGYIKIYKEDKLLYMRTDLSPETINMIEKSFLNTVCGVGNEDLTYIR